MSIVVARMLVHLDRRPVALLALFAVLGPGVTGARAGTLYGPGRHWLGQVRSGSAAFGATATVGADLNMDGTVDLSVEMTGSTEVFRSAARPSDPIHAPRRRDHVDLEITAMHLGGTLPGLVPIEMDAGDGIGNQAQDGPLYSQGGSTEVPGDPRHSADFFDLFLEVRFGGLTLRNAVPLRVVAVIDRLPPIGTIFTMEGPPVPFLDAGGTPRLQVVTATDVPTPPRQGPCDPVGADTTGIASARDAGADCACGGHGLGRCGARLVAARVRSGQLNRGCRSQVRRCLATWLCGAGVPACTAIALPR